MKYLSKTVIKASVNLEEYTTNTTCGHLQTPFSSLILAKCMLQISYLHNGM